MKHLLALLLLSAVSMPVVRAQDPGFRPAEPARPAPSRTAPAADDTAAAVAQMSSMDRLDASYALRNGDTVSLRIVEDGEKVYSLRIQDSGNIQAPYLSLVPAAGRTCRDVAFYMKRELEKQHFQKATVILALEQRAPTRERGYGPSLPAFNADYITVYGQVSRQGRYEVEPGEDLTVSQAILRAGGFSQFAQDEKVKIIRRVPGKGNVTIIVNLRNVMMRGKLEYDIPTRGGDVIIVDEKLINI
jgi:protein involved in polysaccharide export with SLBB domain